MPLPAALRLTLAVTLDGTPVLGFPVERRLLGTHLARIEDSRPADGVTTDDFQAAPIQEGSANLILLRPEAPLRLSLDQQNEEAVTLERDALVLIAGGQVTSIATANPGTTATPYTIVALTA